MQTTRLLVLATMAMSSVLGANLLGTRSLTAAESNVAAHNCLLEPGSMNGGRHPKGCAGAVWSNGKPAWSYCTNRGSSRGRFPWWNACCEWKNHKCAPKPLSYEIVKQKFGSMEQRVVDLEKQKTTQDEQRVVDLEKQNAELEQRHVDLEKQVFRSRMLINMLLDNAPKALNNLEKISAALGGDPDFANTMNGRLQSLEDQNVKYDDILYGAPDALNSLQKISAALGGDPDFANTMNGRLQSLENQKTAQSDPATIEGSPAVENPRIKALEDDLASLEQRAVDLEKHKTTQVEVNGLVQMQISMLHGNAPHDLTCPGVTGPQPMDSKNFGKCLWYQKMLDPNFPLISQINELQQKYSPSKKNGYFSNQ